MSEGRPSRLHLWCKRIAVGAVSVVIAISVCYAGLRLYVIWQYPYGSSHSCDTQMAFHLERFAQDHEGAFPAGEATPEASLSLLARPPYNATAELLRGKTIPKDLVESILARGELLGPETCGWHYIEGLREDDDPRLAILWDKVGLGHNGERLDNGDRFITRIGTPHEMIPGSKWSEFVEEQKTLLEKLPEDRRRVALRSFSR